MALRFIVAFITSSMLLIGVWANSDWPQFRGPNSLGVADDPNLPDRWSATENVTWKTDIPGLGWSSPIVWGDKIFVTSVISAGEVETPKKGLYFGGERKELSKDEHRWVTYCIDWKTGKILWEKEAFRGVPKATRHLKNTYASETPVTDGERVYAYFGNLGLFCYDMKGNPIWKEMFEPHPTLFGWGTAASPVLHKDRIYIVNDNTEKSFFAAFDKKTGQQVWRVDREPVTSWATPYVWENKQRTEIIIPGARAIRSYDLNGKVLWELKGMSSLVIPTPFSKFDLLYITSGYVGDEHRPVYAIRPGASGDISLKKDENSNQYIAWYLRQGGPYNPSPIVYGDYYYTLYDRGFFTCHDAKTGKEIYGKQRIDPSAGAFTSSPWAYNGKIFCLSEDGDTFVIQAGPEFKLLGKYSLDEMCMATPAISKGSLIIRTSSKLYRISNIRKG
jgi:outer membrane protein assembly factor BamB